MKKVLIFAAVILFMASCKKEMGLENSDQALLSPKEYAKMTEDALLAKSKEAKPDDKKDNDNGKLKTKSLISSGSGTIAYTPGGCGSGTLRFNSNGTGNSTVLGFFTQQITFCLSMTTGQFLTAITGVGTTPNGDKLYYTFVGQGVDVATGFTYQDYVITGGTGKYASASGATRLLYDINEADAYRYTGTGTITF